MGPIERDEKVSYKFRSSELSLDVIRVNLLPDVLTDDCAYIFTGVKSMHQSIIDRQFEGRTDKQSDQLGFHHETKESSIETARGAKVKDKTEAVIA